MNYTIREATPADLSAIVCLRHGMFQSMGYVNRSELELTDARFVEWVSDKLERGEFRTWLMEDDTGKIVAGAGLWVMDWPPHAIDQSTQRGNILNVYAEPEFHELGLTRRLLIHLLDYCRDHGLRTIIVNPSDDLRGLYEALGFRPTGEMKIQVSVPN
jgi:GNAT superfamily N-acetyltransferase